MKSRMAVSSCCSMGIVSQSYCVVDSVKTTHHIIIDIRYNGLPDERD
jgi:hypothetical protein